MFNLLNRNSIESWSKELCLLTFYKITYNCVNLPLPNNIQTSSRATMCNQKKFVLLQLRIDAYKFSFYPNVIQLCNNLPDHVT